jgi:hypothetical protein
VGYARSAAVEELRAVGCGEISKSNDSCISNPEIRNLKLDGRAPEQSLSKLR